MRRAGVCACVMAMAMVAGTTGAAERIADRAVVWLRAGDGGLERDLNRQGARGLRLAAVSDGLPCSLAVMQAPEGEGAPVEYRVVAERDLSAALPGLVDDGFEPRASARTVGTRHQVIFERDRSRTPGVEWRVVEFEKLDDLDAALAAAAADGFQARLLVRVPLRSWPGLSERGLLLAARAAGTAARARASRVVLGTKRDIADVQAALVAATGDGWSLDLLFSSARDGSVEARRERLVAVLSRDEADPASRDAVAPARLARHGAFGMFGDGRALAATVFWNEYVSAWTPAPRRQVWASPIVLSAQQAKCVGLELKLRIDAPRDEADPIVGLVARPRPPDGYELVLMTEQRLGPG